jgi:glycine/D-amino acid oxidase-like deaminating enzyme
MTKYGRSPWIDRFPKSRVPSYPRYRGSAKADVVIVGGGLTGCVTAYAFAAAGIRPILLEAGQIGRGASGSAAGIISDDPGVEYSLLEKALGRRRAVTAWQSWRRAALDFQALLRRLEIKCALEPRPAVTVAAPGDQALRVKREQKARGEASIDQSLLTARAIVEEIGISAASATRSRDAATLDPYRACIGLAAAAVARGARLFEHTPVKKITFTRKVADVFIEHGSIRTSRIVVATGEPTALFRSLERHFYFHRSFFALTDAVPARIRPRLGRRSAILRDLSSPPHVVRWVDDERILISGADADATHTKQQAKVVVQRTGQLMYELSTLYPDISGIQPDYGWDASYTRSSDGLPNFGAHRNYPFHLFAFGDSSHSVTGAYLASRIFLRQHLGEVDPADEVFGFHR